MQIHIKICGVLFILLALVHLIFPRYFQWRKELATLSLVNRQLMYVHTFFIAWAVLLMGVVCIRSAQEMQSSAIGKTLAAGLFLFWSARLLFQLFIFSRRLWWGKSLETGVHIVFTMLWTYFSWVFYFVWRGA